MAKPRNRPNSVNTAYFEGITPYWSGPRNRPLPERYAQAVRSLVDFAGPDWPDNEASGFFVMRHYFVAACEKWRDYDWEKDQSWIEGRKVEERKRSILASRTKAFRLALKETALRRGERELGLQIVSALSPDARIDMTYQEGVDVISDALIRFENHVAKPDLNGTRYGPAHYGELNVKLPKRETLVAIVLADMFTELRRDDLRLRRPSGPRIPSISEETPWKAIAQFVAADFDLEEQRISPSNVQSMVERHLPMVSKIQHFPD